MQENKLRKNNLVNLSLLDKSTRHTGRQISLKEVRQAHRQLGCQSSRKYLQRHKMSRRSSQMAQVVLRTAEKDQKHFSQDLKKVLQQHLCRQKIWSSFTNQIGDKNYYKIKVIYKQKQQIYQFQLFIFFPRVP